MNETLLYYRPGKSAGVFGSLKTAAAWLLPTACLALMPKCPVSLALYFTRFTGVELSVATASYLRSCVVVACLSLLSFLIVRSILRFVFEPSAKNERELCVIGLPRVRS